MITVKPYAGLCNRMRTISSVATIAGTSHFKIIWEKNDSLNCDFEKLFVIPDNVWIDGRPYRTMKQYKLKRKAMHTLRGLGIHIPFGYDRYLFDEEILRLKNQNYDFQLINNYKNIYIESQHNFAGCADSFRIFVPVHEIQEKIDKTVAHFDKNTIGVHIRRGDHKMAIENSPLQMFIDEMQREMQLNSDTTFFLSTDSIAAEKEIKNAIPGRVFTFQKDFTRNSENGAKDALVDLWCLSKTSRILGSYWSSFSATASQIGQIDIKVIHK